MDNESHLKKERMIKLADGSQIPESEAEAYFTRMADAHNIGRFIFIETPASMRKENDRQVEEIRNKETKDIINGLQEGDEITDTEIGYRIYSFMLSNFNKIKNDVTRSNESDYGYDEHTDSVFEDKDTKQRYAIKMKGQSGSYEPNGSYQDYYITEMSVRKISQL